MWFSLILNTIVNFVIFALLAKMFSKEKISFPKIERKMKPTKEQKKEEQRKEDIKFNIDNYQGYNSPEREIK